MDPRIWATSSDGLIEYVPLTRNKLEQALQVIRTGFFTGETISVAVGLSKHPEAICELDDLVIDTVADGVSTIAVEKTTGKVAGCLLNKIYVRDNQNKGLFEQFTCQHPTAKAFLQANVELEQRFNAFEMLQTDCYFETMFLGILPQFRRRGIGKKLQEVALEIMQNLRNGNNVKIDIDGNTLSLHPIPTAILGYPTSPTMKKICDETGYTYVTEIDFSKFDFKNKEYTSIFKTIPPILVMCKYF